MEQINGAVSRIVNVSPTGGAIFRILLENSARTVRIVAPGRAIQHAPTLGESWAVFGSYVHDRQYGLQFIAVNAIQQVPSGSKIVSLLARHPSFVEFGPLAGKRLWGQLGAQAYSALNAADSISIARATRITPSAAVRLIQAWRSHCLQIEVSTYFAAQGLPPGLASQAIKFWGPSTLEVISSNPYLLAPFMPWKRLDAIAMTGFAIVHDSPLRLIAACRLSIDKHCLQNLSHSVLLSELRATLKARVGSSALTTRAIELSVASGAMFLKGDGKVTFAQSRGQLIILNALICRLSELASHISRTGDGSTEELPALGQSSLQFSHAELTICAASVIVLSAFAQEFVKLLINPCLARATHIFSSISLKATIDLPTGSKSYLLGQVMVDDSVLSPGDECYVIHGADDIDVFMACKLLHALPGLPKLFFVTTKTDLKSSSSSFLEIVHAIPGTAKIRSAVARCTVLPLTHNDGKQNTDLLGRDLVSELQPSIKITALASAPDLNSRILSTYRRAAAKSTAIIITTTAHAAKVYNHMLHKEQVDVREYERLATTLVQLAGNYTATIGDTIVCCQSDYRRGFIAGSTGKITDIVQSNISLHGDSQDLIVAHAFVDTVGEVTLSLHDCLKFQLGYAVPSSLDKWSCQAVRILCIDHEELPTTPQLQKWISQTTVGLFFAGLSAAALIPMLLKLEPMQFEAENSL